MATLRHAVHSADPDLLQQHYEVSSSLREALCATKDNFFIPCAPGEPYFSTEQALRDLSRYLSEWEALDNRLKEIGDVLSNAPQGTDVSQLQLERLGNTSKYVGWIGTASLPPSWDDFSANDQANIIAHDPDFLLGMANVPQDVRTQAWEQYYASVERYLPVISSGARVRVEAEISLYKVLSLEVAAELSVMATVYRDGTVGMDLELSGEIGLKLASVIGVGYDYTRLLRYRFPDEEDMTTFNDTLTGYIKQGDLVQAGKFIAASSYLVGNRSLHAGYLEADLAPVSTQDRTFRLFKGIGRDDHTNEDIEFFGGSLELEIDNLGKLELDVKGEQLTGPHGDRAIIEGTMFIGKEQLSELVGDPIDTFDGGAVHLNAHLDLNDPIVRDAWERFKSWDLNVSEIWSHARVTLSSAVRATEEFDLGMIGTDTSLEAAVSEDIHVLTFHKVPGGSFRKV